MLIEEVVIDASPLISLFRSQQADLLAKLFTDSKPKFCPCPVKGKILWLA